MGGVYCLITECSAESREWAGLILIALSLVGLSVIAIIYAGRDR